jgi:death on curing protein
VTEVRRAVRYLEVEDLLHIAERLAGRQPVLADAGQLAAAVARPRAVVRGREVYASTAEKAAALLASLAVAKGLVEGNRRLAWIATRLFCAANGAPLRVQDDEAARVMRGVVIGDVDVPLLAQHLGVWMTPVVSPDPAPRG